ncbi:MAG TPA: hypothetical protein VGR45_12295 [Stellaceae bacterium]|nr:hypothetical protein [Stellaceae bacterium]
MYVTSPSRSEGNYWLLRGGSSDQGQCLSRRSKLPQPVARLTLAFGYQGRFAEADHVRCQGSRCMLWRWEAERPAADDIERKGFCGLAGEP